MPAGGSVKGATIDGRFFPVDADADVSIQLSGFSNELKPNGDGSFRQVKTPILGGVEGLKVQIDKSREDLEFLRDIANKFDVVDFDYTSVDDNVYSGSVQIVGDIKASEKESTAELTLKGTLELQ